jgi:hypothetical protein
LPDSRLPGPMRFSQETAPDQEIIPASDSGVKSTLAVQSTVQAFARMSASSSREALRARPSRVYSALLHTTPCTHHCCPMKGHLGPRSPSGCQRQRGNQPRALHRPNSSESEIGACSRVIRTRRRSHNCAPWYCITAGASRVRRSAERDPDSERPVSSAGGASQVSASSGMGCHGQEALGTCKLSDKWLAPTESPPKCTRHPCHQLLARMHQIWYNAVSGP